MNIEYSNTIDDLVAFQKFHIENSKVIRSNCRKSGVVLAACLFIVWIAGRGGLPIALAGGIAGFLLFPTLCLKLCVMGALRTAKRFYTEGRNVGTLGWHRLSITENSLREESEAGVSEFQFGAVERIAEGETFAFVYMGAVMAYVIPKQRIASGDLQVFLRELGAHLPPASPRLK